MKAVALFLLFVALVNCQSIAIAWLRGTALDAGVSGWVKFSQTVGGNVTVEVNITGITQNPDALHAIHVHAIGDTSDEQASLSTGGHYNPLNAPHGCPDNGTNRHFGDMGNFQATGGSIVETKVLDLLQLNGATSIVGRAVVLHQNADDCVTATAYGTRLAHGVVGIVNTTVYGGTNEALQESTTLIPAAICVLKPTTASGMNVSGHVWFFQTAANAPVDVYARVEGITGEHGFHLHWWGDISSADGTATGGHYNPLNDLHGVPPAQPRHKGDMGIIYHYVNGVAYYQFSNPLLTLNGQYNVIGRAIHVHANSDDCTNPVGSGGARWAQCVIGLSTNATAPSFPAGVPTSQNGTTICSIIRGTSASTANTVATSSNAASTQQSSGDQSDVASLIASFVVVFAMLFLSL